MIKNEKQLQVTEKQLVDFRGAMDAILRNQQFSREEAELRAGLTQTTIAVMVGEIEEYKRLKNKQEQAFSIYSLGDIPHMLIKARIAVGFSQADLADALGLKAQQIQRYESTDYETASFARMLEIAEALGLECIKGDFTMSRPLFLESQDFSRAEIGAAKIKLKNKQFILGMVAQ